MNNGVVSFIVVAVGFALSAGCPFSADAAAAPEGLTVERRTGDVCIDPGCPRFGWVLPREMAAQTAYELEFDGVPAGRVAGGGTIDVKPARSFGPGVRVTWRVRVWDGDGAVSDWSAPASFVTGLGHWSADWIGVPGVTNPAVAKTFVLRARPVRATLYVTAPGFYEAYANGRRIGDKVLDPAPTDYTKRVLYSTYPVEEMLAEGTNELRLVLGHGWYDVRYADEWNFDRAPWRAEPCVRAELAVEYADGRAERILTDASWRPAPSTVISDDIREAEVVGLSTPPEGARVAVAKGPSGRLAAEVQPGARVVARLAPVAIEPFEDGWMLDFGTNLAGWVETEVKGLAKGSVVSFRYDERRPGTPRKIDIFFRAPSVTAAACPVDVGFQTDRLVGSGTGRDAYSGHFNYSGFRYVTVKGLPAKPSPDDFRAAFVSTDFAETGSFRCSDATFNRLVAAAVQAYRSNFTDGVPTDCPHREKNGWTCDAMLASVFAQYQFDNTSAYEKWCRDLVDSQTSDGRFPTIIPTSGWGLDRAQANGAGAVWGAVMTSLPLTLYRYQDDRALLEEMYPAMKRYVRRQLACCAVEADGLANYGIGDWCSAAPDKAPPYNLVTTAYAYRSVCEVAEAAKILGGVTEAVQFEAEARQLKTRFDAAFRKGGGVYGNGRAADIAIPLACGLVERPALEETRAALVRAVEAADGRIDFGLIGSATVFRELSKAGRTDLAWRMILRKGEPSFADMLDRGATTLWESFQGNDSLNHVMFADFVAWAYEYVAGIAPLEPGWKKLRFAPQPVPGVDFAEASVQTPYGRVTAGWRRRNDGTVETYVDAPASIAVVR